MNEKELKKLKRDLKRYRETSELAELYERESKEIELRVIGAAAQKISDMPRGGHGKTMDELLAEKADLDRAVEDSRRLAEKRKEEIRMRINRVTSPRHNRLLWKHYINGKSVEEIADEEGYSTRQEWRIYKEAHELLLKNESDLIHSDSTMSA